MVLPLDHGSQQFQSFASVFQIIAVEFGETCRVGIHGLPDLIEHIVGE